MNENRRETRFDVESPVNVAAWIDGRRVELGSCVLTDVSASGVCLRSQAAAPLGTKVEIVATRFELTGTVRHCEVIPTGYKLGVSIITIEFADSENPPA
jgi:hypothetical protein